MVCIQKSSHIYASCDIEFIAITSYVIMYNESMALNCFRSDYMHHIPKASKIV